MPTKWNDPKRGYDVLRPEVANRGGDATRCHLCGAIRIDEQIGLEVTPDAYIANLVEVFRECKRILRDDGTLWVNIGDSYNGSTPNQSGQNGYNDGRENRDKRYSTGGIDGLKPKDLIGIPWMLAFALRADGWYLRQDIIWAKPNPMPESVKDRCTKSHEYIFLLSKSKKYYYDNEAVMEVATGYDGRKDTKYKGGPKDMAGGAHERWQYKNLQPDGQQPNTMHLKRLEGEEYQTRVRMPPIGGVKHVGHNGNPTYSGNTPDWKLDGGVPVRNKRDVWTVTTKPYKGAHYATFNPDLIKPCILAGAPEGGIVFDPFVGSGTTVATAIQLGRKGIGLDLSLTYLYENAKDRIEAEMLPLLTLIEQE
jgi:DNA modification methylase